MRPLPKTFDDPARAPAGPHRAAAAVVATVLLLAPWAAAQPAASWWRALYRGTAGAEPVVLDLTLEGTQARGRLLLLGRRRVLDASGTASPDGSLTLSLRPSLGAAGAASAAPAVGTLDGTRSLAPNDDGSRLTGRLVVNGDGASLALVRVAQYLRLDVTEGPIHARSDVPDFLDPALASLDAELAPAARAGLATFVREGRDARAAGALLHGWELIASTDVEGMAGPYVSLRTTRYRYTGGAHGIHDVETATWWLDPSGPRRLALQALFAPGTGYLGRLGPLVLARLRAAGAQWVVDGQVSRLGAQDLALYNLTPAGLAFTFPPYAVGPYVQGTFTVTVPYDRVLDLAASNGALEAFARAGE